MPIPSSLPQKLTEKVFLSVARSTAQLPSTSSELNLTLSAPSLRFLQSLATLTESLATQLFNTNQSGARFSALDESYLCPFDGPTKEQERNVSRFVSALAGGEGKICWEPNQRAGLVHEMLSSGKILEPRVLDLGCGVEGAWLADVGSRCPLAEVHGLDLVPVEANYLPSNVTTEVWHLAEGLPFPDAYFNVVHSRSLLFWRAKEFQYLDLTEITRVLAPGGVLIMEDSDTDVHNFERDHSALPWHHLEPLEELSNPERLVFRDIKNILLKCPESRSSSSRRTKLAFSEVHQRQWDVHLGWRDGAPSEPPSTRTGNHPACTLIRPIHANFVASKRVPERISGIPSWQEEMAQEIRKQLMRSDSGLYIDWSCIFAVRSK